MECSQDPGVSIGAYLIPFCSAIAIFFLNRGRHLSSLVGSEDKGRLPKVIKDKKCKVKTTRLLPRSFPIRILVVPYKVISQE